MNFEEDVVYLINDINMTQEDKELLLKDLSSRLPYGVKVHYQIDEENDIHKLHVSGDTVLKNYFEGTFIVDGYKVYPSQIKPYLRPMNSMTQDEIQECDNISITVFITALDEDAIGYNSKTFAFHTFLINYCLSRHLDIYGLIEKGLALKAPEEMYK